VVINKVSDKTEKKQRSIENLKPYKKPEEQDLNRDKRGLS